jgi:hypothetical protein
MADRSAELTQYRIAGGHLIFTDESADRAAQILGAYLNNQKTTPPDGGFRRISK